MNNNIPTICNKPTYKLAVCVPLRCISFCLITKVDEQFLICDRARAKSRQRLNFVKLLRLDVFTLCVTHLHVEVVPIALLLHYLTEIAYRPCVSSAVTHPFFAIHLYVIAPSGKRFLIPSTTATQLRLTQNKESAPNRKVATIQLCDL